MRRRIDRDKGEGGGDERGARDAINSCRYGRLNRSRFIAGVTAVCRAMWIRISHTGPVALGFCRIITTCITRRAFIQRA